MNLKKFGIVSILDLVFTIGWLVFMILGIALYGEITTMEQALKSIENLNTLFYITYINATVFTILTTILFVGLHAYCKPKNQILSGIGIIFIPVYCILNLVAYFSQISVIPFMQSYVSIADSSTYNILLSLLIQAWPESLISIINNLAYAILGIPSITYGLILLKGKRFARISGVFLILNAIACFVGIIGIVLKNPIIGMGSAVGGVLFIVALVYLALMFNRE